MLKSKLYICYNLYGDDMVVNCKKCNLPNNYPYINIGMDGVCNFCKNEKLDINYLGVERLKSDIEHILNHKPDRSYDCIVALSGGRDSSYLLYFARKVLKLNVLAVTLKHDFLPVQTLNNILSMTKNLGVDLKLIDNKRLNKYSRKNVRAWAKKPDSSMLVTFCTGCRYGIKCSIKKYALKNNIPILLMGDTPYEDIPFRTQLLTDGKEFNKKNIMLGYTKKFLKNLDYFSIGNIYNQYLDFMVSNVKFDEIIEDIVIIKPFGYYIDWHQCDVVNTITKYGWKIDENLNSSWRSDCYVNLLRQYYYKKMLGFNDLDAYYAKLIKNDFISKEEAMNRISSEGNYDDKIIRNILFKYYNLNFDEIEKKIEKGN